MAELGEYFGHVLGACDPFAAAGDVAEAGDAEGEGWEVELEFGDLLVAEWGALAVGDAVGEAVADGNVFQVGELGAGDEDVAAFAHLVGEGVDG